MTIDKIETTVTINSKVYPATQYGSYLPKPIPVCQDSKHCIFGSSDNTVYVTIDVTVVDHFINILSEDDFIISEQDADYDLITIIKINGTYLIVLECDMFGDDSETYNFIEDNMVVFGEHSDDVAIHYCYDGYEYCIGRDDVNHIYDNFINHMSESKEDELMELSLYSYMRIIDNNLQDRKRVDSVLAKFIGVYP